jgi:hypothetical protein
MDDPGHLKRYHRRSRATLPRDERRYRAHRLTDHRASDVT